MKKKNAFTLIELLATIAIISAVSLVATITYNKIQKDIKKHQYENLKGLIEIAGVKYSSQNGYYTFFVQDLINEGYLEPDDETDVYDPRNNESLNCHVVYIEEQKNGTLVATLGEESYDEDGKCSNSSVSTMGAKLKVTAKIEGENIEYSNRINNRPYIYNGWTKYNLDLTADVSEIKKIESITNSKFIWNNNTDNTTVFPATSITTSEYGVYDDYYFVDMYTLSGSQYETKFKYKYDAEKPVLYKDKGIHYVNPQDENNWAKSKTIYFYASDKNGSGLSRVYIGGLACSNMITDTSLGTPALPGLLQTYEIKYETGVNDIELNVCLMDNAGNIAEEKFTTKMIDITPPKCDSIVPNVPDGEYTNQDRTITVYCDDNNTIIEDGVERVAIASGCTSPSYSKTYTSNEYSTGSTHIYDNAGWRTTCSYNVNIDKLLPTVTMNISDTSKYIDDNVYLSGETFTFGCTDNGYSGVNTHTVYYRNNSGSTIPLSWTPGVGTHYITQECTDNAGNVKTKNYDITIESSSSNQSGSGTGASSYVSGSCSVSNFTRYSGSYCSQSGVTCTNIDLNFKSIEFGCKTSSNSTFTYSSNQLPGVTNGNWIKKNCKSSGCTSSGKYYKYTNPTQSGGNYEWTKTECSEINSYEDYAGQLNSEYRFWKCD